MERTVRVGEGITLRVAEEGTGPLVVLVHGFPELGYSWRHQLPALAGAGAPGRGQRGAAGVPARAGPVARMGPSPRTSGSFDPYPRRRGGRTLGWDTGRARWTSRRVRWG